MSRAKVEIDAVELLPPYRRTLGPTVQRDVDCVARINIEGEWVLVMLDDGKSGYQIPMRAVSHIYWSRDDDAA